MTAARSSRSEVFSWSLLPVLVLGLAHGLLYVALLPPWQHYDEPSHFEYIRLIAERGRLPQPADYDLEMRRQIAASMQAFDFWKGQSPPPIDLSSEVPPIIGTPELYHPPLYYALLALPQRLVMDQSVEAQLYVARLCSVLLYPVVLVAAYGAVREAFPQRKWLPLAVAAFIALLPPFADRMSAVNNDTGAVAATSLLLWASVRLVRWGPSLRRVAAVLILTAVSIAVKSTAGIVALSVVLALGVGYLYRAVRGWFWLGLALLLPLVAVAAFGWRGYASHWYSDSPPPAMNQLAANAPVGDSALVLSAVDPRYPRTAFQELPPPEGKGLGGHTVTLGAWIKAAKGPNGFAALSIYDGQSYYWHRIEATADWQFRAFTATLDIDPPGIAVYAILPEREGAAREVYLDGLVLVDGEMPLGKSPTFQAPGATTALWGDRAAANLLQNGSVEASRLALRGRIGWVALFQEPISRSFQSVLDWHRTGWVYPQVLATLLRSFWGSFGWNHLALPVPYFYPLGVLGVLSLLGPVLAYARLRRSGRTVESWQLAAWGVLALSLLVGWGSAILRVHPVFLTRHIYLPVARYADVVIVSSATWLCAGLAWIVPRRWVTATAWLGLLGMLMLDAVALWVVILPYYYG